MTRVTAEQIDALLPQTQCGQCGHGGCMPYAKAMEQGSAAIDLCPPGGTATLSALAKLLQKSLTLAEIEAMQQQETAPVLAHIRADECIGCTKCIQACPVDAIVGAAKQLHTILKQECTGCGLCVEPCPVDCIDLLPATERAYSPAKARERYQKRQLRLQKVARAVAPVVAPETNLDQKKAYIQAALARSRRKKNSL